MSRPITSGLFTFLTKALGLSGEGAQTTQLDDGFVALVLGIENIAAYSQSIGSKQGWLSSVISNTHAAAGDVTESMNPYSPGTRIEAFGAIDPAEFDFWYFGSSVRLVSSSQTVDEVNGWMDGTGLLGISEGLTVGDVMVLHRWTGAAGNNLGAGAMLSAFGNLQYFQAAPFGPFLWPRDQDIVLGSQTSGAGATVIRMTSLWCMVNRALKPSVI